MERDRKDKPVLASWQGPDTSDMSSLYMLIFMGALGIFFAVGIVVFLLYGLKLGLGGNGPTVLACRTVGFDALVFSDELGDAFYGANSASGGIRCDGSLDAPHAWGLSLLFVLIQIPALAELLRAILFTWIVDALEFMVSPSP